MAESDALHCTLTPQEQRTRRSFVRANVVDHVACVRSIENGLSVTFNPAPGLRALVLELIELEKGCCGFLTFSLSAVQPSTPGSPPTLLIEGPPDAAQVIEVFRQTLQGENA